jgi:hypothetical protein
MSAGQVKNAGGELRVAGARGHVDQVLRMTSMHQILGLHPTAGDAAEGF